MTRNRSSYASTKPSVRHPCFRVSSLILAKPLLIRLLHTATSQAVRQALAAHPTLPELLRSIDVLRGEDRDDALQRALGVSPADVGASVRGRQGTYPEEDVCALRQLAEAVESAVRGGTEGALGLDWGD